MRDYGVKGQLGLEPDFNTYIDKLCTIYDEVKRLLRKDGTCFVNLGDTYNNTGVKDKSKVGGFIGERIRKANPADGAQDSRPRQLQSLPAKSLCLIPQRFAIEMVNRGWILRNVIIWHKPNPMPSSAKDRFTVDFEYVYFFVKNNQVLWHYRPADGKVSDKQPDYKNGVEGLDWEWGTRKGKKVKLSFWQGFKYWFEQQFDNYAQNSDMEYRKTLRLGKFYRAGNQNPYKDNTPLAGDRKITPLAEGKNKRCVWTIPTQAFSEAHFATFPEKLVEPMILSGCPEFVCTKCGKARKKMYDVEYEKIGSGTVGGRGRFSKDDNSGFTGKPTMARLNHFKGYTDCGCGAKWRPGVVLDPFAGRARPAWLLPRTDGTGWGLSLSRSISTWLCAA